MNHALDLGVRLPLLAADPYCLSAVAGSPSQVSDVFLVPYGVRPPALWYSLVEWRTAADNEITNGIRHVVVSGGVDVPQKFSTTLPGLRKPRVRLRRYTLSAELIDLTPENLNLVRRLQNGRAGFRMWYATLSGRVFGGPRGLHLLQVDADQPQDPAPDGIETATLLLEWLSRGEVGQTLSTFNVGNPGSTGPDQQEPDPDLGPGTGTDTGGQADLPPRVWGTGPDNIWGTSDSNLWGFDET